MDVLDVAEFEKADTLNLEAYVQSCPLVVKSHDVKRKVRVLDVGTDDHVPLLRFREMVIKLQLAKR